MSLSSDELFDRERIAPKTFVNVLTLPPNIEG